MRKLIIVAALCGLTLSATAQISKPRREYVDWLVTTNNQDRVYNTGDKATITVQAYKGGVALDGVTLRYKVGDEMFLAGKGDSTVFRGGKATIDLGTRTEPGFRACDLRFEVYGKTYKDMVKVGYNPGDIQSFTAMPKDFDSFWHKALKEAGKVDLAPELTPLPQYSTDKVEVSLVKLAVGPDGRNMYGYLTRPKDGQKHPVLLCPPGAGAAKIKPDTHYSEQGFIYMNINIHSGCNPELSDEAYAEARKVANNYNRRGIENRQTFYYRSVYAGCARCIDYLCSLADWDGRNVGVTGGSQGGALTIVTAALNPKVTFCAPFYPALCDLLGFKNGRAGGWPKYFQEGDEKAGAAETLPYYDVVNFARRLTCPVFYSFGYADDTCSPTSTYAAYNAISAPKTLAVTLTNGHWRFPATNDEAEAWMRGQVK